MPTVNIPDKVCKHCGGTTWYTNGDRYWCYSRRNDNNKALYKNRDKELHNEKRRARPCYLRKLEKEREKRKKYRELNPIIRPPQLTTAERSARHYAKRKNDPLYKEKNAKRAAEWLAINKEKLMTSDRYAKRRLGDYSTPEQRQMYITYLKALRQLKQLENEESKKQNNGNIAS